MTQVKSGDTVKVHYTGKLVDGTIFDCSEGREPLEFKVGSGQVIKGFDDGVTGMAIDDEKTVEIAPEEAYGPVREDMVIAVPKTNIPENINPEVGMKLQMQQPNGMPLVVTVTNISDEDVTLDANHHLAGKTLVFDLKLVGIN